MKKTIENLKLMIEPEYNHISRFAPKTIKKILPEHNALAITLFNELINAYELLYQDELSIELISIPQQIRLKVKSQIEKDLRKLISDTIYDILRRNQNNKIIQLSPRHMIKYSSQTIDSWTKA